jgi:tetratricopeptide (TPR) repeat protein
MRKARVFAGAGAVAGFCAVLAGACHPSDRTQPASSADISSADISTLKPPEGRGLRPVALPDLSHMNEPARTQMQSRYSSLRSRISDSGATPEELATSYGEMGKLLMAATYFDAAESCYLNAQALAPADRRWPYYLGHLYKVKGPLEKSAGSFERALQLQPDDVATLVWLGDAYIAQGRAEAAERLFAKALALQPDSAAARFGAGRVALARKDYPGAVKDLEEALALEPRATAIHYQLAIAYRGRGDLEKAQAHLGQRGDIETRPPDPLMREIDNLLQSAEAYNVRGGRELDAGNWAAAAENFRKGLELAPADPSLRHRLGTALFQVGDAAGAEEQFREVTRRSPEFAKAHFSLGVVLAAAGRHQEAIESFSKALAHDGGYLQARLQLANVLARSGHPGEALVEYRRVLERDPALKEAQFGSAMALVRLHRYRDARDRLGEALKARPGDPLISYAQARLLAAAPDPLVRNGAQAKALVDELLKTEKSIDVGATAAMTLAELGEYEQAAAVQRDVIAAAEKAGLREAVRHMMDNLKLYEHRQPCRTPFADDELP